MKFDNSTRDKFLGDTVYPAARFYLRRMRLDFGNSWEQENDGGALGSVASDDFYDNGAERVIWGDSCVLTGGAKVRMISDAAYNATVGAKILKASRAISPTDDWSFATGPTSPVTWGERFRLGLFPHASTDTAYLWYFDSSQNVRVGIVSWSSGWSWDQNSSGGILDGFSGAAIHPVSASDAYVIAYDSPALWIQRVSWSGSAWTMGQKHIIKMSEDIDWSGAQWSDAEPIPGDTDRCAIAINLASWGSAYVIIHREPSDTYSLPREIYPSQEEWGNLRVWLSGMSTYQSRLWAVVEKVPVGSGDVPMAQHVSLLSSANGLNWRDEDFVAASTCRGKLLYVTGESDCFVVGSGTVTAAPVTKKIAATATAMEYLLDEVYEVALQCSGVSSAQQMILSALNQDPAITDGDLWEVGNRVTMEIMERTVGTYELIATTEIVSLPREETEQADNLRFTTFGQMNRLMGQQAYVTPAARSMESPFHLWSTFQYPSMAPRQTVRAVTGTWTVTDLADCPHKCLKGTNLPGISLVPHSYNTQGFHARVSFRPVVSLEGFYIVFWYEDEENYWSAGLEEMTDTNVRFTIKQTVAGVETEMAYYVYTAYSMGATDWIELFVECKPGYVRMWAGKSLDFNFNGADDLEYDCQDDAPPPGKYHIGVRALGFEGFECASYTGDVEESTSTTMTDDEATFGTDVVGQWVRCKDQVRRIVRRPSATQIEITPGWSYKPTDGDEYGIYTEDAKDGPSVWVRDVLVTEAKVPYCVDQIATAIMEQAGVTRDTSVWTGTLPALGSSSPVLGETTIIIETEGGGTEQLLLWCSSVASSGETAFSGMRLTIGTLVQLEEVEGLGSAISPYQQVVTDTRHPAMTEPPSSSPLDHVYMVHLWSDGLVVSIDGAFMAAFPIEGLVGGYCSYEGPGDAYYLEFGTKFDVIWDTSEPAGGALSRILEGRRAKMIERRDGSVALSRFDTPLGDLGSPSTPVVTIISQPNVSQPVALIEMVGAEERGWFLNKEVAHLIGARYIRQDNPTLMTQEATIAEAVRSARLIQGAMYGKTFILHAADPAAECEDTITIEDEDFIVTGTEFTFAIKDNGAPEINGSVATRAVVPDKTIAVIGTAQYGDGSVYG